MRTPARPLRWMLVTLAFGLAAASARAEEPRLIESLKPFVDSHQLAGAVTLVAGPDKVLGLEAIGSADLAAGTPMRTDAIFWIASMSKPITATALMILVDEGKVKLDDPVERYLPEFRGQMVVAEQSADRVVLKAPAHPITVREVLSHTSGLPFLSRVQHKIDTFPLDEQAITFALSPLKFEPGTKYDYSNAGINTAGRIVEAVSGTPFETFLAERLTSPLGMKDTTFWPSEAQLGRLAKSYRPAAKGEGLEEIPVEQLTYPLTDRKRGASPAGGLFSTAADMARFGQMILNGGTFEGKRYISEAAVRELTSTQTGTILSPDGQGGYGLGFSTSRKSTGETGPPIPGRCGHGGAYATDLAIDPARKLVLVFMIHFAGPDAGRFNGAFSKAVNQAYKP